MGISPEHDEELLLINERLRVTQEEQKQLEKGWEEFSEEQVQQAIVHQRQDIILLVGHLSLLNDKVRQISSQIRILIIVAVIFLIIALADLLLV